MSCVYDSTYCKLKIKSGSPLVLLKHQFPYVIKTLACPHWLVFAESAITLCTYHILSFLHQLHSCLFQGCPSKDLRTSIVVSPTDVGYHDHIWNILTLYGNVPTFDPEIAPFYICVPTFGFGGLATMQLYLKLGHCSTWLIPDIEQWPSLGQRLVRH